MFFCLCMDYSRVFMWKVLNPMETFFVEMSPPVEFFPFLLDSVTDGFRSNQSISSQSPRNPTGNGTNINPKGWKLPGFWLIFGRPAGFLCQKGVLNCLLLLNIIGFCGTTGLWQCGQTEGPFLRCELSSFFTNGSGRNCLEQGINYDKLDSSQQLEAMWTDDCRCFQLHVSIRCFQYVEKSWKIFFESFHPDHWGDDPL